MDEDRVVGLRIIVIMLLFGIFFWTSILIHFGVASMVALMMVASVIFIKEIIDAD